MKKFTSLLTCAVLAFCLVVPAAAASVSATTQTVYVDGTRTTFEAYNIDGNNYFKLRDIACVLNGTARQFSVGWDADKRCISITNGQPYTRLSTDLQPGTDNSATARISNQTLYINGSEVSYLSAWNIGGSNFFKLRDLAAALDFTVTYDAAENAVLIKSVAPPTVLAETGDAGQSYIDSLTFLGDSTTYGLKAYGVLSGGTSTTQVWTPASGTLTLSNQSTATIVYPATGKEITIAEAARLAKPEYLVITLGINGISFMDQEYFTSEYTKLVQTIQAQSPSTKIILNSIYPVAASYRNQSSINNTKIDAANEWIRSIAEATGTRYCDTASALKGSDGFLPERLQNGDGLHLNAEGLQIVLNYLRTHAYA